MKKIKEALLKAFQEKVDRVWTDDHVRVEDYDPERDRVLIKGNRMAGWVCRATIEPPEVRASGIAQPFNPPGVV